MANRRKRQEARESASQRLRTYLEGIWHGEGCLQPQHLVRAETYESRIDEYRARGLPEDDPEVQQLLVLRDQAEREGRPGVMFSRGKKTPPPPRAKIQWD
jgi:hypothetical protein